MDSRNFIGALRRLRAGLPAAMRVAGDEFLREAASYARLVHAYQDREGKLTRSIGVERVGSGTSLQATDERGTFEVVRSNADIRGAVVAKAKHAAAIEYGFYHVRARRDIPARPFIRPAMEANRDVLQEGMHQAFTGKAREVGIGRA